MVLPNSVTIAPERPAVVFISFRFLFNPSVAFAVSNCDFARLVLAFFA